MLSGVVFGCDTGGDGKHGLAALGVRSGMGVALDTCTLQTANDVIARVEGTEQLLARGVDSLTC